MMLMKLVIVQIPRAWYALNCWLVTILFVFPMRFVIQEVSFQPLIINLPWSQNCELCHSSPTTFIKFLWQIQSLWTLISSDAFFFRLDLWRFNHWVYCVKNLSHSLLFGRQFLRQFGVNIYNDRGILKIKGVSVPFISSKDYASMLVLSKTTKVLPNSEQIVHVKGNAFKKNLDCRIRPLTNPIAPGLQFGNEIIKNDGKNCILSVNRTGRTIRLRRNTPIAYLIRSVAPLPEKPAVPSNFNLVISSPPSIRSMTTVRWIKC